MTALPQRALRCTRERYYELDRLGHFAGRRVERVRGEVIDMSPINWPHVVACRRAAVWLEGAFAGVAWVSRNEQPLALADSDPQPDVIVVPGAFEDYTDHPTTALLVVEVSDTTLARDTTTKAELYAEAGIAEYWVLDLNARELIVFRAPQALAAHWPGCEAERFVPPSPAESRATAYQSRTVFGATESVSPLGAPHATVCVGDLLP
jgi:Uma2 family endonuclease